MDLAIELAAAVAAHADCTIEDVFGTCRRAHMAEARQMVQYIMYVDAGMSKSDIARRFGISHTTVIHSIDITRSRIDVEEYTRQVYEDVRVIARGRRPKAIVIRMRTIPRLLMALSAAWHEFRRINLYLKKKTIYDPHTLRDALTWKACDGQHGGGVQLPPHGRDHYSDARRELLEAMAERPVA